MGRVVPTSFPSTAITSEGKYRQKLADDKKNLPLNQDPETDKKKKRKKLTEEEILNLVNEINAYFTSYNQHLLVLISKKQNKTALTITNTKTQELVKEINLDELLEVAQNLRNHKLTLIERDV